MSQRQEIINEIDLLFQEEINERNKIIHAELIMVNEFLTVIYKNPYYGKKSDDFDYDETCVFLDIDNMCDASN